MEHKIDDTTTTRESLTLPVIHIKTEPEDPPTTPDTTPPPASTVSYPMSFPDAVIPTRRRYMRIKSNSSQDTSVCEVCQAEFTTIHQLQAHKLCHFNTTNVCYTCDAFFVDANQMMLHMATVHPTLNPFRSDEKEAFLCQICILKFSNKIGLRNHLETHANKDLQRYICKICALDFQTSQALVAHMSSPRHQEMKIKIQTVFICVDCRSIFPARDAYAMHMMMRAQTECCATMDTSLFGDAPKPIGNLDTMIRPAQSADIYGSPLNLSMTEKITEQNPNIIELLSTDTDRPNINRKPVDCMKLPNLPDSQLGNGFISITNGDQDDQNIWPCHMCSSKFNTCDALAMHMMTKHVSDNNELVVENVNGKDNGFNNNNATQAMASFLIPTFNGTGHNTKIANLTDGLEKSSTSNINAGVTGRVSAPVSINKRKSVEELLTNTSKRPKSTGDLEIIKGYTLQRQNSITLAPSVIITQKNITNKNSKTQTCDTCQREFENVWSMRTHMRLEGHKSKFQGENICKSCGQPKDIGCLPSCEDTALFFNNVNHGSTYDKVQSPQAVHLPESTQDSVPPTNQKSKILVNCLEEISKACNESNRVDILQKQVKETDRENINKEPIADTQKDEHKNQIVERNPTSFSEKRDMESDNKGYVNENQNNGRMDSVSPSINMPNGIDQPRLSNGNRSDSTMAQSPEPSGQQAWSDDGMDTGSDSGEVLNHIMAHSKDIIMCKHCKIVYMDRTVYYLHMGLHNLNNPWQCNMCGKVCRDLHEFTSHVIHY